MKIESERTNMPFNIKDCTLITRMAGIDTAMNLRELRERTEVISTECLFHHFCETVIRPTFDDPDFRNDFAIWAARIMRDGILAERLGILNPYSMANLEELRRQVLDILDERISEVHHFRWAPAGEEFQFMQAVTVIFDTGMQLTQPEDLIVALPQMSLSSIYYHFVEARRRTETGRDDFTTWLTDFGEGVEPIIQSLHGIDFYFLTLAELKQRLIDALGNVKVAETP